jgi:hypothetical protein
LPFNGTSWHLIEAIRKLDSPQKFSMKAFSLLQRLRSRLRLELDAITWRNLLGYWRCIQRPVASGTLLICDLHASPTTYQVQALIASCLEIEQGLKPIVLLPKRQPLVEKLYRAACARVRFCLFS